MKRIGGDDAADGGWRQVGQRVGIIHAALDEFPKAPSSSMIFLGIASMRGGGDYARRSIQVKRRRSMPVEWLM
jgi:hypothetical protein